MKGDQLRAIAFAASSTRAAGERALFTYTASAADFPKVRDAIFQELRRAADEILFAPREDGAVVETYCWRFRAGGEVRLVWTNTAKQRLDGVTAGVIAHEAMKVPEVTDELATRRQRKQAATPRMSADVIAEIRAGVLTCPNTACTKPHKLTGFHSDDEIVACWLGASARPDSSPTDQGA